MTTFKSKTIFGRNEFGEDFPYLLGDFLYKTRVKKQLPIRDIEKKSGIELDYIDRLETARVDNYDIIKIAKLLDIYQEKLPMSKCWFEGLPENLAENYFSENV